MQRGRFGAREGNLGLPFFRCLASQGLSLPGWGVGGWIGEQQG